MGITRREFIVRSCAASCALCSVPRRLGAAGEAEPREAMHYERAEGGLVRCVLCPRGCVIAPGLRGHCGVRRNDGGRLRTLVFGRPCTFHNDPIEKKPLFHFLPGTSAFSIATAGCNIECRFCQNWEISQAKPEDVQSVEMPPEKVVERARAAGSASVAYACTEPIVFYEYVHETARLGRSRGIRSVMITNGFIREEPMRQLLPHLAAVKVDLKAFTEKFYRDVCDGALAPVLSTLKLLRRAGTWHEVVVLLVPTLNDSDVEIAALCRWVKNELGAGVPVHFTRYHPTYKMRNLPPTPVATLNRAREIGLKEGLDFVYLGNVPGHPGENTWCPKCGKALVTRVSYQIDASGLKNGACRHCGRPIPGVWT